MIKRTLIVASISCLFLMFLFGTVQADERFIDNGDGTVTDTLTNLMWATADNMGNINWHEAKTYCENPPLAGYRYSDWRMPSIQELRSLHNKDLSKQETDCGLGVRIHPAIRLSCAWVWASDNKSISAYAFSFRKGYQYLTLMLNRKHFRALPVRSLD